MVEEITVLLADDHVLVRRGFRRILEDEACITIVGEAADGDDAVQMACKLRPRIVLMDCAMPRVDGVAATKRIVKSCPETSVLMLSMHSEASLIHQAIDAGARGYVLKNARDLDLVSAIKRVAVGELVLEPQVSNPPASTERDQRLTARELEILQLIVDGKSTREIAVVLSLSVNTVSAHRTNIAKALGVHKTADMVVYAIRHRLVKIL